MDRHITLGALALAAAFAGTAHADLPEGLEYSDFDAYFELENEEERDRNNRPVDAGWYLEFEGRIYGDGIPIDSGLKYVVKQGRRTLATVECNAQLRQRPNYHFPDGVPGYMELRRCKDDDQLTKATGEVTIEVYFINGDDDSTSLIRTHTIFVRKFDKVRAASEYYIVHNGEIATAVIHERGVHGRNAANAHNMSNNYVGLFVWVAEADDNGVQPDADDWTRDLGVRCSVDGERLPTTFEPRTREVRNRGVRVMASWGEGRQNERNQYDIRQYHIVLPITMGGENRRLPNSAALEDHPGQWECLLRHGRQVARTIRFTVADGHIQPHPEEVAENGVRLQPGIHLATMTIAEDADRETRISPAHAARGPFFGLGWQSEEGRAMAAGLPTIGEADLPGEPRSRRRRRRGRRR